MTRTPARGAAAEDPPVGVADEIGELQSDRLSLVAGASVFVLVRCMTPAVVLQELRDPRHVRQPHREVEIVGFARHRTDVEVHGPATEQPVVDPSVLEKVGDAGERCKLPRPRLERDAGSASPTLLSRPSADRRRGRAASLGQGRHRLCRGSQRRSSHPGRHDGPRDLHPAEGLAWIERQWGRADNGEGLSLAIADAGSGKHSVSSSCCSGGSRAPSRSAG